MKKLPNLKNILDYKNPLVIKRFGRNYPEFRGRATQLFEDMLKYLWLCAKFHADKQANPNKPELAFNVVMHKEMAIIDEMWHTFILITKDYAAFCEKYFGEFIHHVPEIGEEARGVKINTEQFEKELRLFLSYTYEHLGAETLTSWFSAYTK